MRKRKARIIRGISDLNVYFIAIFTAPV